LNQHRRIATLFRKYINNECTAEEAAELMTLIRSSRNKSYIQALLDEYIDKSATDGVLYRTQTDRIFQKLNLSCEAKPIEFNSPKPLQLFFKIAIAAILILVSSLTIYIFNFPQKKKDIATVKQAEDVLPGGNKATLVLSDGQQINLGQPAAGSIAEAAVINKSTDGQPVYFAAKNNNLKGFNTVRTPRGGQFQIVLPDGSKVWLNAASSITYPAAFAAGERRVTLSGEAYFEITSLHHNNKKVPFIVESGNQKIEVLGTKFNVNAYDDETGIKTTLIEGKVKVTTENETVILKPNQEFDLGAEGISTKKVDVEPAIDWKNGDFIFADENIQSIMRKLARWYNVKVVYDSEVPEESLSGQISRNRNLSEVLRMLELSGDTKFRIENDSVHISFHKKQ